LIINLKEITIQGDIEELAFSELTLTLEKFTITGTIRREAFWMANGKIKELDASSAGESAFLGSDIHFNQVHLEKLDPTAQLETDSVSLFSSEDVQGVSYAKTVIIRENFTEPLDLEHLDATHLDFSKVKSKGPFHLKHFNSEKRNHRS
jgi:hypothetical protein